MGWYDDLQARVSAAGNQALQSIDTYLIGQGTKQLVQIAATAQGGNLTAEQIAAGQFGGTLAQSAPASTLAQNQNSIQSSQIAPAMQNSMIILVAGGVIAYLVFSKKARR